MADIIYPDQENYLEIANKTDDKLILEMERFAKENNIPILERISANFLEKLVYIYSPQKCLEIGMAIGYSTIRVAKILKKETKIDTIEFSKQNIIWAKSYIEKSGCEKKINILEGDAKDIMAGMNHIYDFIFLDADKEDYMELLDLSLGALKKGGVILVDNLLWKGYVASEKIPEKYKKSTELIREFNAKFLNLPNLNSSILPIGDGLGLGIKLN